MRFLHPYKLVCCAVLAVSAVQVAHAQATYRITRILAEDSWLSATKLNNAGMVTGVTAVPGDPPNVRRAFRWSAKGGIETSRYINAHSETRPVTIDDSGRVTGSWASRRPSRKLAWTLDGTEELFGVGTVIAGNANGDVIGSQRTDTVVYKHYVWLADGRRWQIARPDDAHWNALNNHHRIAGFRTHRELPRTFNEAAVWTFDGQQRLLGQLPGAWRPDSVAADINDLGEAVGHASAPTEPHRHGFHWSEATGMVAITPPDRKCDGSHATAINNRSVVVGGASSCTGNGALPGTAWVRTPGDRARWLHNLIDPADPLREEVSLSDAIDINDAGQVLVNAFCGTGDVKSMCAVLLTPVTR